MWVPESEIQHKVSVVFSFPEEPGQLFNALSAFALREINLTKIESRPFKDNPIKLSHGMGRRFQYRFYIDFIGHLGSDKVQNAIVHLQVTHLHLPICCELLCPQSSSLMEPSQTLLKMQIRITAYYANKHDVVPKAA